MIEAYCWEYGMLPDSAFAWLLDGHLIGTGASTFATGLPVGWHDLTLRVTDSDGQTASDTVRLYIGPSQTNIRLPVLMVKK